MSSREVTLVGGSPWGFRMHGGHDLHQPLRISRVNPGSKAAQQGVREGDLISSINGRNTRDLTNSEAHTLLRNAGDQLKLGLNQESAGSPKRRIYKSSLQENTSIETIQKITKTTKTSATRLLSSDEKRNGADDTRDERDFTSQNGNLNTRNETTKFVTDETTNKTPQPSNITINYKKPEETSRMPQSSRSRRNRRNRNKASGKSKNRTEVTKELPSASSPEKYSPKPEDVKEADGKITRDDDGIIEAKVNGQAVKVTTEVVETPGHEIGSISKQRETVKRRYKLQRHALNSQPKICEVTTISDLPMEAHIGHVPGVGIVETSLNDCDDIRTIVTEPVEPIGPLSSDVTSRVKSLGERDFALALLPATVNANKNGPEIHEVTDSDVETTEYSTPDIISEVESDIEIITKKNDTILEETEESDSTDKHALDDGRMDQYKNVETSVVDRSLRKISKNGQNDTSDRAIIIEPESDVEFQEKNSASQTIFEETEESDSTDKESTLPLPIINKPEYNNSTSGIKVKQTLTSKDTDTERITIDSQQEIKMACEDKIKEQKPLHNVTVSKESSKCNVDSNEKTMQVKSKEFTSASSVIVIGEDIQQPTEIYEQLFPQQFQDKVGFFIEECDLVSEKRNDYGNLLNDNCHDKEYETCNNFLQRHLKRVELQENRNFDTCKGDRYLDIIHEEGEKPVCHEAKHIRDFINEEIGKFRREKRKIDVDERIMETRNNEFDFCHVTMKSTERNENILESSMLERKRFSFDPDEGKTNVAMNQVNEEESDSVKELHAAPLPPRRSSSFHNKDEKAHYEKPKIPDLPNEVIKTIRKNNNEYLDLCPPLRPPLPENFNEKDVIISRNDEQNEGVYQIHITPNLRNSIEDAGKFGNDDTVPKSTKIACERIDNIASEVPVKNTWALKETTPICAATMLNNVEVKCPRPQESQFTETKEEKVIILETLKRECIETTEVESSNVVEIKETKCNSKKSVDVSSSSADEKLKVQAESEKEFEKIEETAGSQDSSSSNASPVTVKFVPEDETHDDEPTHLSDLCVKKILSMPYGSQIIKEISHPKFNIFKNLEPIHKSVKNLDNQKSENSETMKKRPHTWMGVPTSKDPHLLVCLSPSQQEANVVTSADKLLDLHQKFLNRRSYHGDQKNEINVPKYHVEVPSKKSTLETMKIEKKEMEQSQSTATIPSNRLLEIIKENPIREDLPWTRKSHKDVEQNRLKSTQLANWLTSTNNDEVNSSMCKSSQSCNFSSEQLRYQEKEKTRESAFSPVHRRNGHIKPNDSTDIRAKRQGKIFEDTNKFNETANRINSALILRTPDGVQEHRSSTLINKTPITSKSAIIDRTSEVTEPRKRTLSRTIDSRHVNPALINYKPEAPPRCRRTVEVDRACIDTTSIFNKSPARGHLESRIYQDPEDLKQATASEIVGNLKQLQKGVRGMADGRERYSLPQEYFDRQFEYIEKLEDQLKEVILAEEEEKKAFEDYEGQIKKISNENHQKESPKASNNDSSNSRQTWHEETNIEEKNRKEFMSKEGHQECKKSVIQVPGHRMENSMEVFVNKEKSKVTSESEKIGPEWARFFDDISRDSRNAQEKRDNYRIHEKSERPKSIPVLSSSDEVFRRKMYDEYVHKVTEREERKHHKVIKISSHMDLDKRDKYKDNMSTMEKEFIEKAKNRLSRFGIQLDEGENQSMREEEKMNETHLCELEKNVENEEEEAKCIIDGKEIRDAKKLPKHLQEFLKLAISELEDGYGYGIEAGGKTNDSDLLHEIDTALRDSRGFLLRQENMFSPTFKASSAKPGVWSPNSEPPHPPRQPSPDRGKNTDRDASGIPPVWTPSSAGPSPVIERKEFRPVSFESPILSRKHKPQAQSSTEELPPWKNEDEKRESSQHITHNITTRIVNSHSVPSQGLNTLANAPRLPRAQNPTITLLQKAREGQLPKGAAYLEENEGEKSHERATISPGEIIYTIKREYESEGESDKDKHKKMADLGPHKVLGIGPITRDGMPVALRSEIRETNQAKWYKQMYDSLHRAGRDDDYETIRYKPRRGARYGYASTSGYLSEPEPRISVDRSVTLDTRRRQRNKENDTATSTMPRKSALVKTTAEVYRNQPGRIENYQPGRSSISEKETKEWWDEVMDIFDGAEEESQLRHPMALRTFIPTHQLVRSIRHNVHGPTPPQSLHPKTSLRTTRAVLEYNDPDAIEVLGRSSSSSSSKNYDNKSDAVRYKVDQSSVNLLLGRTLSSITAERLSNSLSKSPKYERNTTMRNRRNTRDRTTTTTATNRDSYHSDDSIVVSFIDETINKNDKKYDNDSTWNPCMLEERSKSFVLPCSSRKSPLIGNRTDNPCNERTYLTMSPRNYHRNHQNNQRQHHHDPSISSSTSSSSSSTIHITMLPPPLPINTNVIAETALTSPSRPFDQRNPHAAKPYMSHALKESGYESDSTLIFRRRDDVSPLSPLEQRLAYKTVQKGGDVPLHGFRKPAPERPKDDAEIEYFPITRTLTRIRVRRRTASSSASMSSMIHDRYRRSAPSSTTHVPREITGRHHSSSISAPRSRSLPNKRPPSPPRRLSSRHSVTLKLYASNYPQPPNPRHEQCFAAESASNIKFLREKLSNKFLKNEQSRVNEPIRPASVNHTKLPRSTLSKRKSEPSLSKKESDKSLNLVRKSSNPTKTGELKPPIARTGAKITSPETGKHLRGKNSPSSPRKEQCKLRKSKRETDETLKRGSSADLSSQVGVRRVVQERRQGDALTGSVIKSSSSLLRIKSQDTGALSKVIQKSRNIQRTAAQSPSLRSPSPISSISLSRSLTTPEPYRQKSLTARGVDPPSTIVVDPSRKKLLDKPQTIVKCPTKKIEAIVVSEKDKIDKKKNLKKEKTRGMKSKKLINGKTDVDKKKSKKIPGKSENSTKKGKIEEETSVLTMERIRKHTEATRTDTFFQNLFLRKIPSPTLSQSSTLRRSLVMERAKMFQEFGNEKYKSEPSLRSLNVYLTTKRPVSNSRFRNWERESLSSRSSSPYGISWPGRSVFQKISKFDDLLVMDEFGSSTSLRGRSPELNKEGMKERSLSEPPIKVSCLSDESFSKPSAVVSRSSSPSPTRSAACRRIRSLKQERTDFSPLKVRAKSASETDDFERRKITFGSNSSLAKSTSSLESSPINREEYQRYLFEILHSRRKSSRYKDLHDFYASLERMGELVKTTSSGDLRRRLKNEEIIDYDRWKEIRAKERAEQELKVLYGKLKTIQREKDFLFSTKDIERSRWHGDCGLRCKERSVENIRESFRRLAKEESELETTRRRDIASKKDVYKPLWRGNSVVNVASNMTKRANPERCEIDKCIQPSLQKSLGGSNKFWSSLSVEQVNALKNQLNEIYGSENGNKGTAASKSPDADDKSSDQIDNAKIMEQTRTIETSDYEVIVPPQEFSDASDSKALHVRCHSMLMSDIKSSSSSTLTSSLKRSGSICNGRSLEKRGDKPALTESEKKRLSLNLGKEILDKVSKRKSSTSQVIPRETRGAIAVASAKTSTTNSTSPRTCYSLEASIDEDCFKAKEKSDFLLVLTPNNDSPEDRRKVENVLEEWSKKPPLLTMALPQNSQIRNTSGSEIDSATESSENSVKTVVQRENDEAEDVPRKIEFFESIEKEHYRTSSRSTKKSKLSSSQSFADLKELFGETDSARYATLPFRSQRSSNLGRMTSPGNEKGRSTSASPDVPCGRFTGISSREHDNRPRSVSPCRVSSSTGSFESLRQRSVSPDPERYWRAYLNLVKHGAVRKIREKFESLEELSSDRIKQIATPKRFQSDPELTRNFLKRVDEKKIVFKPQEISDVAWLRRKYEPIRGRSKWRNTSPPIPRIPLRLEDLQMPHINVISKTVELKDSMSRSSSMNSLAIKAETDELEAKKPVGRLRGKFEKLETEKTSILGEMFTSAPDVHELRDISPYLAGKWVAHRYPSRRDNARSISLPPELETVKGEKVKLRESKSSTLPKRGGRTKELRTVSASPVRSRRPGSILKQTQTDPFANQPFDPSKHRPRYRYQPPPPLPPAPVVRRPWWPPMPTYTARPTVTFEGPNNRALREYTNAPPPPPKTHQSRIERPESPRRYVEGEVTIHYRSPVRTEAKEILSEEELARKSAENMRRVYQEERRRKYLQELHDIDSRRHTDNFTPSQKSPIPLNRYDDFIDDLSYRSRSQEHTPEPRLVARALYNFVGQTTRELSFRRGDIILIRRQIDKNWYEGEHNAMIGLFPLNYVEILPYDGSRGTPKKSYEGQARAKFNFIAQTNLELSLAKGELVVLTRRVDENWFEGRIGNKKGIFPVTYVEVILEPGQHRPETPVSSKPVASPAAHSMLSNGTASGKLSMGPHHYTPSIPVKTSTAEPQYISLPRIGVTERNKLHVAPVNETLHIDTHSDTIPYRALYNYRPQNEDELELKEGDTVYVMEKCDDGWFVGSSQRTGYFGTFPGNYVERL